MESRGRQDEWKDLFDVNDRKNVVLDFHGYVAWNEAATNTTAYCDDITG